MSVKRVRVPPMTKNFLCRFFGLRLFFANFLNVSKGSLFHFFPILQNNGCSKTPKGPPFTFFGTMRITGDQKKIREKISKKFKKWEIFEFFPQAGTVEENTRHIEVLLLFLR